jgi:hypothetical protein
MIEHAEGVGEILVVPVTAGELVAKVREMLKAESHSGIIGWRVCFSLEGAT